MATGTVVYYDVGKGFGFIEPDGCVEFDRSGERRDNNVFVHIKTLKRSGIHSLSAADRVTFDVVAAPQKGKQMAANIKIIGQAQAA
jgi:cold shock CspA family protein